MEDGQGGLAIPADPVVDELDVRPEIDSNDEGLFAPGKDDNTFSYSYNCTGKSVL